MIYKPLIKALADKKISKIFAWYERKQKGLGYRFLDEWEESVHYISEHPLTCSKKYKNFRHEIVGRFPYLILFEIEKETVVIYQVIGAPENPSKRYRKT
jgi:hypothetical protein